MNARDIFNSIEVMIERLIERKGLVMDWVRLPGTFTYASATTMTCDMDLSGYLAIGHKFKYNNTTQKFAYLIAFSVAAGVTTLTITGGSDYTIANAAITNVFISYAADPRGHPGYFNYTPTFVGFVAAPTIAMARFSIDGRWCEVHWSLGNGTSNANNFTITIPVTAATLTNAAWISSGMGRDNNIIQDAPALIYILSAGTVATITLSWKATNTWTTSGNKTLVHGNIRYRI